MAHQRKTVAPIIGNQLSKVTSEKKLSVATGSVVMSNLCEVGRFSPRDSTSAIGGHFRTDSKQLSSGAQVVGSRIASTTSKKNQAMRGTG